MILGSAFASNSGIWSDRGRIGGWGGSCLCGDGLQYQVGSLLVDGKESCDRLSCENGIAMGCADEFSNVRAGVGVVCGVNDKFMDLDGSKFSELFGSGRVWRIFDKSKILEYERLALKTLAGLSDTKTIFQVTIKAAFKGEHHLTVLETRNRYGLKELETKIQRNYLAGMLEFENFFVVKDFFRDFEKILTLDAGQTNI